MSKIRFIEQPIPGTNPPAGHVWLGVDTIGLWIRDENGNVDRPADTADITAAIAALNLGTASQSDTTDFANAAQGTLADSALQSGDNISELVNDSGYISAQTQNLLAAGVDIGSASAAPDQNFQIDCSATGIGIGGTVRLGNAYIRGDLSTSSEFIDVGFGTSGAPKTAMGEEGYDDLPIFRTDGGLIDDTHTLVDIGSGVPGLEVYVSPSGGINFSPPGMPNGWWWQFKVDILAV